ncbi:hypothetical protein B9Z55_023574 [Caenorhabditis nigoni]|uniref:Uncharacterized protein n=1 Tax=Caenorhabditis nigoni TaxID=1611254 RepID=A0A2G5SQS2_9PELO|nr:hypothetical protein B9Z55_023574 [Caenorhabditis nigoni]
MSWKTTGFLCEYDSKNVKIFDCNKRKLHEILNTYGSQKLELGKFYETKHMWIKEASVDKKFHSLVAFRVDGGSVLADTVATMANDEDLKNNENFEKFSGKVWSQYLGFLRDPKNLFAKNMNGGELGWVTVKYAPEEDTVFEIEDVAENYLVNIPAVELLPTPWSPDYLITERPRHLFHPLERIYHDKLLALAQWCRLLGSWYQHEVNDKRRDQKDGFKRRVADRFDSITAVKMFKIDPPLPTTVVNGNVEFEVEFPFDHDVLETKGNREIADWSSRFRGLQKNAHFWNEYLGKVEIYPRQARNIIQKVEAWPLETISAAFTVVSAVSLHYNVANIHETYPENGIFLVTNVKKVKGIN